MADEAAEDTEAGPQPSKLPTLLAIVNLVITLVVGIRVMTLSIPAPVAAAPAEGAKAETDEPGPTMAMDPFVVNLNEAGGSRFLRAVFELEVKDDKAVTAIETSMKIIRDNLITYLSGLSVKQTKGEEAKTKIKETILTRLNEELKDEVVKRVLFVEFVVQ